MEAIFESAPQILISTAFLIKSTTTSPSPTVIASILTSLYSLSARVSADDKVMLKDEWKQPKHRNKEGKWVWPFINIKYMVRVFLWRFLEISSRITLLVLTWINLGGRSIIFILFIEFCYLSVLAWALGTIDIMGNLIYLMAANSKRKEYKWAVPMAKIFWVWRVLSAYALLITVTVYAVTDSEFGMDALDNEAGATRYYQTFIHPAGLLLFVYSWTATPLWQWVGAIVIFDYKNLASVGRDVDTLIEDGKWNQVLELVSFGAAFNPVKVLQKIERHKSKVGARERPQGIELKRVDGHKAQPHAQPGLEDAQEGKGGNKCVNGHDLIHQDYGSRKMFFCSRCASHVSALISWHCHSCDYDICAECYTGTASNEDVTPEEIQNYPETKEDVTPAEIQKEGEDPEEDDGPNCPEKHGLTEFKPESDGFRCDICGQKKRKGDMMYGCRDCDYDVCAGCKEGVVRLGRCDKGHILKHKPSVNKCSRCKRTNKSSDMVTWHCDDCAGYNLCDKCYEIKRDVKSLPPIDQLALICADRIAEDKAAENDQSLCGNVVRLCVGLCEYLCSCSMFLVLIGLALLGGGIWYAVVNGTQGDGFYFSIFPIVAAAVMFFCAVSCCFNLFEKWSECLKKKVQETKRQRKMSKAMGRINCPGKHGMTIYETEENGLSCDLCKKKVSSGTRLYGCRECNYDVCTDCKPEPVIEELPEPTKKPTELDELVTCPQKHSLIPHHHRHGQYECNKCNKSYQKTKSWHCKECDYHLCETCFDVAQANLAAIRNLWMKDRQRIDNKPILTYGGFGCLSLIGLVFLLGLDIVALIANSSYECDITGGSGYLSFNVETFLQVGSIMHLSICACAGFCVFVHVREYMNMEDEAAYGGMGCGCVAFMLFTAWVVIGFLLYSEMTPEKVVNDEECMPTVLWWTVVILIQVLVLFVMLCYQIKQNFETAMKYARIAGIGLVGLTALAFFIGSDIAALIVNGTYNCDIGASEDTYNTEQSNGSEYVSFNVEKFLEVGSVMHLCMCGCFGCVAIVAYTGDKENATAGGMCCGCVSFMLFLSWTVVGFLLHSEMTPENVMDDAQCIPMVLSWSVIVLIQVFVIFLMGCYLFLGNFEELKKYVYLAGQGLAGLTALAFFIGSDIAALIVNGTYNCDIGASEDAYNTGQLNGSEYVSFNVEKFLEVGSAMHLCMCGCFGCIAFAVFKEGLLSSGDKENATAGGMCCGCVSFMLFLSWTVVGFLLHSEMTPENVMDDAQCIPMVLSWSVIVLIQVFVIFLMGCYVLLDNLGELKEYVYLAGQGLAALVGGAVVLTLVFGPGVWPLILAFDGADNTCHNDTSVNIPWDHWFHVLGWSWIILVIAVPSCVVTGLVDDKEPRRVLIAFMGLLLFLYGAIGCAMYDQTTSACRKSTKGVTILVYSVIYIIVGPLVNVAYGLYDNTHGMIAMAGLGYLAIAGSFLTVVFGPGIWLLVNAFDGKSNDCHTEGDGGAAGIHWDVWFHLTGWSWLFLIPSSGAAFIASLDDEEAGVMAGCCLGFIHFVLGAIGCAIYDQTTSYCRFTTKGVTILVYSIAYMVLPFLLACAGVALNN
eukprot:608580_1